MAGIQEPPIRASEALNRVRSATERPGLYPGVNLDEDTTILEPWPYAVSTHGQYHSQLGTNQGVTAVKGPGMARRVEAKRRGRRYRSWSLDNPVLFWLSIFGVGLAVCCSTMAVVIGLHEVSGQAPVRSVYPGPDTHCKAEPLENSPAWKWVCPSLDDLIRDTRTIGNPTVSDR